MKKNGGDRVGGIYSPEFRKKHAQALKAGQGGGDFFTSHYFVEAIRSGKPPFLDVYRGVAMSIVGILAYRSALDDSNSVVIPDLRKKSVRGRYRHDHWSADPTRRKKGNPWPSILGNVKPTTAGLAMARKTWRKMGYDGSGSSTVIRPEK